MKPTVVPSKNIAAPASSSMPLGQTTNSIFWMQKQTLKKAALLPKHFETLADWQKFKQHLRRELPRVTGLPAFPRMEESRVRGRAAVGEDVIVERVDVYVDEDYSIPAFVFLPASKSNKKLPAVVWNPGWPQDKYDPAYQQFGVRMAKKGFVVLVLDHAPFGETAFGSVNSRMTLMMGMGDALGIADFSMRTAETMRCGEYLRARPDIDPKRVAVAGLCQGGMDTWMAASLDDGFCAAAPIASVTTFEIHATEYASHGNNSDSSPYPFGILNVCDIQHLYAAIAPRPLLVRANLGDNWWPISAFDVVEKLTREVYALHDASAKVDFRAEAHEHNLTGPFADALEKLVLLKYV